MTQGWKRTTLNKEFGTWGQPEGFEYDWIVCGDNGQPVTYEKSKTHKLTHFILFLFKHNKGVVELFSSKTAQTMRAKILARQNEAGQLPRSLIEWRIGRMLRPLRKRGSTWSVKQDTREEKTTANSAVQSTNR